MEDDLFKLALAFRARGGARGQFLEAPAAQAARAYGVMEGCRGPPRVRCKSERPLEPRQVRVQGRR